ncbi:hypothetical protein FUA48_10210 [Flavobacterium alkalisoli]|uniref:Uncharacterized protein n=1 Tax=Flavobacterium alkalisoli TaxID=2602769 RepID=A0A5B9FUK2_9FLAO|nr:hypothetical protein [Flavobacterium alkalisoli]QEE49939.1 hypothetical protein FUA48_10210 [Flavobacterium alkalisoli]
MQDLINEEEFVHSKPYNPWKWFLMFYCLTIAYILFTYFVGGLLKIQPENFVLFMMTDFTLPFVMIFAKKQNILLPYKTIIAAVTGIYIIYISIQLTQLYLNLNIGNNPLIPKSLFFFAAKTPLITKSVSLLASLIIFLSIVTYKRRKVSKITN